jgi:nickel-type superoxide dismutase maturation protease
VTTSSLAEAARCKVPVRAVALATLAAALTVVAVLLRPRRVVVTGPSMEPTLAPGDRLLVLRATKVRAGDVVAVRDPADHRRLLVKRVSAVIADGIVVRGDNPRASTDSRMFGPVPRHAVVGRVVRRYAPEWRAGPVR